MLAVVIGVLGWSALAVAALRAPEVKVEQAAALSLVDDDRGKPMFTAGNLAPGQSVERCIKVRIDRGSPDQVALATRATGTGLERLELTIDVGDTGTFADCSGFRGQNLFAGTLADLVQQYPRGMSLESWSPDRGDSKSRTYRIRARMSEQATQGELAASATFLWQGSAQELPPTSPGDVAPDGGRPDDVRPEQGPAGSPSEAVGEPDAGARDTTTAPPLLPDPGQVAANTRSPGEAIAGASSGSSTGRDADRGGRNGRGDNAGARDRGRGLGRDGDLAGAGANRQPASEPTGVVGQLSRLAGAAAEGFRRAAERLREGVEAVAQVAEPVAKRAALPALLIAFSIFFFFLQDLLDRRDPKLALAPLRRTEALSFSPPPAEVTRT